MRPRLGKLRWSLLGFCALAAYLLAQNSDTPKSKEPVAVVSGQAIYEDQLLPRIQGDLRRLRAEEFEVKSKALENLILEKLLEAEAKKRGLSVEDLLEQEVDSKVPEATDAELEQRYQQQKGRLNRSHEEAKPQLRQEVKRAKVRAARQAYLQQLWDSSEVTILLDPPRVEMDYDRARVRGKPDAPVVIVEFSDYQCPYCRRAQPILQALLAKYPGQITLAYRDFPLREIHPQAQMAAEASRCAGEQGKFWEYHDVLFARPSGFDKQTLAGHAQSLSLDPARFLTCVESGKYRGAVEEDLQAGMKAGVNGTPAFFINGVFLEGAKPASAFERIIDAELAARKRK